MMSLSLRLDVGRLDDRPPLLDLGFLQRAEGLGRLPVAREDFLPERHQALTHSRVGEGDDGGGVELGNHVFGRPLGREQPAPD